MNTTATSRTEEFTGISSLVLNSDLGDVRIACTQADGQAQVRLSSTSNVDLGLATVRADGGRLTVDVPALLDKDQDGKGFSFRLGPISISTGASTIAVEVDLPHGAAITAKTKSGDIVITGEAGPATVTTGSGDVTVDHADAVRLSTGSGDVSARSCRGGVVTTGSGDITVDEASGSELQCRAGSGDVSLRHTQLEHLTAATGSGDITLHLGQGSFECKTGTGDVDVTLPQGIPVWLDLSSGTGRVARDIDPVGAPAEGQAHLSVKAKSGVGDIRVHH